MMKSGRSYSYWLARFNRKMSFHFPQVVRLISDRSVWHNGKQPKFVQVGLPRSSATNVGYASTANSSSKFKRSRAHFSCQPRQQFVPVFSFQPEPFERSSDAAPFFLCVGNHRIHFKLRVLILFIREIQPAVAKKTQRSDQSWMAAERETFSQCIF